MGIFINKRGLWVFPWKLRNPIVDNFIDSNPHHKVYSATFEVDKSTI